MKNLRLAFKKAKKGKSKKPYVKRFEKDLENKLTKLKHELESTNYRPRKLQRFIIHDPRSRVIYASDFRDRIVHHALCTIIEPIFDKTFIHDSYANRKNKGAHAALNRFQHFKRKVSQNGRLVKNSKNDGIVIGYVLKADIKHYFDTVDHEILTGIIKKKIADERILSLIEKIINNHECKIPGKGMPIGNLTSQLFANIYLNKLDYFVKHRLRAKCYIRYGDDFVILHRNRTVLIKWKDEINEFLKTIKLELHPEKSRIYPLHHGAKVLGFRVFYYYKLPYKRNFRRFNKRLNKLLLLYKDGIIFKEEIMKSVEGWFAYAMWGNTYKMRKRILKEAKFSTGSTGNIRPQR
jgi:retron-type reverse transcriptase